jgi:hypothetical protein
MVTVIVMVAVAITVVVMVVIAVIVINRTAVFIQIVAIRCFPVVIVDAFTFVGVNRLARGATNLAVVIRHTAAVHIVPGVVDRTRFFTTFWLDRAAELVFVGMAILCYPIINRDACAISIPNV